jgi:hypothetical protein
VSSGFDNERQVLEAFLQNRWDVSVAPVAYENVDFVEPAGIWCRFTILRGTTIPAALGGMKKRTPGVLTLQIFSPQKSGTKAATDIADRFASIFDLAHIMTAAGMIRCDTTSVKTVGVQFGWHQINAQVTYQRDEDQP